MAAERRLALPGVLSAEEVQATAHSIAVAQEPSGALPWFPGGHVDPWDHVECAMALSSAGWVAAAERAYEWARRTQREDGSWPAKVQHGRVLDDYADTNFTAYVAVGVWHHVLVTGDERFARRMWPMVRRAVEFVLRLQTAGGEVHWAATPAGPVEGALLAGCASIHQSLRCAADLAAHLGHPRPGWRAAADRLAHVVRCHPGVFQDNARYAMDWYYPVLGGAVRGGPARSRLERGWAEFVVPGRGIRCVRDRPWVTGAETCELVLSLDAVGEHALAVELLADVQHLRDPDGSYWTGLVYADGKRWPVERSTWTAAAMVLAVDALSGATAGSGIFRETAAGGRGGELAMRPVEPPAAGRHGALPCGCAPPRRPPRGRDRAATDGSSGSEGYADAG